MSELDQVIARLERIEGVLDGVASQVYSLKGAYDEHGRASMTRSTLVSGVVSAVIAGAMALVGRR